MMDSSYPTIMLLRQLSGQEQDLGGPSVDPFNIPDLDDPYEQEKLNEGLSLQPNDIKLQQMHDSLKKKAESCWKPESI